MYFPLRISVMTAISLHLEADRLLYDRTFDPNSVFVFLAIGYCWLLLASSFFVLVWILMYFPLRISVMTAISLHLEADRLLCDCTFDPNSVFVFLAVEVNFKLYMI